MTGVSDSKPTLLLVVACLFLTTTGFSFSQPQTAHQLGTDRVMSAALAYPGSPITPRVSAGLQAGIADGTTSLHYRISLGVHYEL